MIYSEFLKRGLTEVYIFNFYYFLLSLIKKHAVFSTNLAYLTKYYSNIRNVFISSNYEVQAVLVTSKTKTHLAESPIN